MTLALPGIDALPRSGMLSQWFTPADVARRMADFAGSVRGRVLEPSAGDGALVRAWSDAGREPIEACDIDRALCERHGWECCDYLARRAPPEPYALTLMNPPYEGGLDGDFLAKAMDESLRVIALVRLAALAGAARYDAVWRRVENHDGGWWMPGLAVFSSRPVFNGPEDASGSAKSDFVCVKLSRVGEPGRTAVEWWR